MSSGFQATFVVAANSRDVLEQNLLASPCLQSGSRQQILIQKNYSSAAIAYNGALQNAVNNLVVFLHQDLFLPNSWLAQLEDSLSRLEEKDPNWGVAGCWGARADGKLCGYIYSSGLDVLGEEFEQPIPVQTLDEIVLIVKKDSGLRFDDSLPHFHFYGADICMKAAARGRRCYAVSAFCIHNTHQLLTLPKEFYTCYRHVKTSWKERLPIQTSCIKISRFDGDLHRRKAKDFCRLIAPGKRLPALRVPDPMRILKNLQKNENQA